MADVDINILVQGMLRKARQQPDPAGWLTILNGEAVDAVAAGDLHVLSHSYKGQSGGTERKFNAQQLLQLTELCLQRLEAETAAGGADKLPPSGAVVYGDFS